MHGYGINIYSVFFWNCCYIITHISSDIVIHRISGDAPKDLLIAPEWNLHKKWVLNGFDKILKEEAYKFSNCNYVDVAKMTTYQYLKRWLKTYVKNTVKDSTYISYEGYVENHFKNTIGEIPLKKLNTHTI